MDTAHDYPSISPATLETPVRHAIQCERLQVAQWDASPLTQSGNPTTAGLYHVRGHAVCDGQAVPWTVVLKIIQAAEGHTVPASLGYWRREALVYESGLLDALPPGLVAPKCLEIEMRSTDTLWLWLEAIETASEAPWPLSRYGLAAQHLGRFNGTYVVQTSCPSFPWLQRDYLREWAALGAAGIDQLPAVLHHPRVRTLYPAPIATRLLRLWEDRNDLVRLLATLPQTFCHMDALRRNMVTRPDTHAGDQTVLLDWGEAGLGALGEDLAAFVTGSIFLDAATPPAQDLDAIALAGYLEGLHDIGWRGDRTVVEQGYTIAAALRILGGTTWVLQMALNDMGDTELEQAFGQPIGKLLDGCAGAISLVVERLGSP